jgi:hypothetical protein
MLCTAPYSELDAFLSLRQARKFTNRNGLRALPKSFRFLNESLLLQRKYFRVLIRYENRTDGTSVRFPVTSLPPQVRLH